MEGSMVLEEPLGAVAVFVDAENVAGWLSRGGPAGLLRRLACRGQVEVMRAYGNWSSGSIQCHQKSVLKLGFRLVHTVGLTSGKNTADIELAVDVMDMLHRRPQLNTVVLATSDSDFVPLLRRLRERGLRLIGVGPKKNMCDAARALCHEVVDTTPKSKSPEKSTSQDKPPVLAEAAAGQSGPGQPTDEPVWSVEGLTDHVHRLVTAAGGSILSSTLRHQLVGVAPGFHQRPYGFSKFTALLRTLPGVAVSGESVTLGDDTASVGVPSQEAAVDRAVCLSRRLRPFKLHQPVAADVFEAVWEQLRLVDPGSRSEVCQAVDALLPEHAGRPVRLVHNLLYRAQVLELSLEEGCDKATYTVPDLPLAEVLDRVDRAIVEHAAIARDGEPDGFVPTDAELAEKLLQPATVARVAALREGDAAVLARAELSLESEVDGVSPGLRPPAPEGCVSPA